MYLCINENVYIYIYIHLISSKVCPAGCDLPKPFAASSSIAQWPRLRAPQEARRGRVAQFGDQEDAFPQQFHRGHGLE